MKVSEARQATVDDADEAIHHDLRLPRLSTNNPLATKRGSYHVQLCETSEKWDRG